MQEIEREKENGIDIVTILSISGVMIAILSMAIIRIYINKEIYYESIEITKIKKEFNILKEEQISLVYSINKLRYKNLIADMISDIQK
jgi:hypothetical protein